MARNLFPGLSRLSISTSLRVASSAHWISSRTSRCEPPPKAAVKKASSSISSVLGSDESSVPNPMNLATLSAFLVSISPPVRSTILARAVSAPDAMGMPSQPASMSLNAA